MPLEPPYSPFDSFQADHGSKKQSKERPAANPRASLQSLRVRPSDSDQYSSALSEQLLVAFNPTLPITFEVIGLGGEVEISINAASQDAPSVHAQVQAHYPSCEIFQAEDVLQRPSVQLKHARGYRLRRSHLFGIKEGHRTEPYATLVGFLGSLEADEGALFQVLFIPTRYNWESNILRVSRNPYDPGKSAFSNLPQLLKEAQAKISKPLFAVGLRIAASSKELLNRLEGSFLTQFQNEENSLVPIEDPYPIDAIRHRLTHCRGMLLNAGELAALVHVPDPDAVPETLVAAEPGAPTPQLARQDVLVPLGTNRHQGVETAAGISAEWLTRHVAIFGGTGYGKTNLMKYAFGPILNEGYGMAVLDPKGDLARGFLDLVPEHRVQDVIWFDPTDRDYPPALNVLQASQDLEYETLTAELMVGLKRLFQGNSEFGPRMEWLLRNAIRALLASEGEKTLYDIPRFLENDQFRGLVLATVQDRELREFWQRRNLSQTVVDPVLNRLSSFLDRPTVRHIVSQPNRIDFRQIMREGKIFIANLEKGILQDAAFVLGSFILSRLQLAALARRPDERRLFPILVDEFHNLAGPGMDTESIETFLSEARSYRAPLVTATQYVGRLNRDVITSLFGNAGTLICLHLGPIDAHAVQRELGDFTAEDLLDLGVGEAIVRMGSARDSFNVKVPLVPERTSHYEAIVALSRELYCQPRLKVESEIRQGDDQSLPTLEAALPTLKPEERQFLDYVVEHPEAPVTAARQSLGLGGSMALRIRERLTQAGFLQVVETRMGKGGNLARFAVPTAAGLKLLGKTMPGRGGPVHRHSQQLVARHAATRGFEAQIEKKLTSGGYVDVHLERNGEQIAVEVSVVPEVIRELRNVEKCLKAGYPRVVCLFLDEKAIETASAEALKQWSVETFQRVTFAGLGELQELI